FDGAGNVTGYQYDPGTGRLTRTDYGSTDRVTLYNYDSAGQVTQSIFDATGTPIITTYQYDGSNLILILTDSPAPVPAPCGAAPVPAPGGAALFGAAIAALGLLRRRARRFRLRA